ncbi:MAG: DUF6273 domain-containing protein, partial [Clostridiales bacterium]|nr:DUF6273 domain-containing protein [Clostridiales bacterium]
WYEKAVDRGNEDALCRMAELMCTGTGVAKDLQRAKTYAEKAQKAGSEKAMDVLRMIYEETHKPLDLNSRYETVAIYDRETVEFGSYPTQKDGTKAPIEWLTLARREEMVLLISKYYLYSRPYDRNNTVSWKDSELRKWLNEDFFWDAFSVEEQEKIQMVEVKNGYSSEYPLKSEGKRGDVSESTVDSIFCLSVDEAVRFFTAPGKRARAHTETYSTGLKYDYVDLGGDDAESTPTPYALAANGTQIRCWWLRTPGAANRYRGYVCSCGAGSNIGLSGDGVDCKIYIRPAMWVKLQEDRK